MYPIESETPSQTNNNLNLKINWQKVFIFLGCLSIALILAIFMGFQSDEETKTLKQCDCSSNGSILDCDDNGPLLVCTVDLVEVCVIENVTSECK